MHKWILLRNGIKVAESDSILELCQIIDKSPRTTANEAVFEIRESDAKGS
jgi:hypothetical protein